MDLIHDQKAKFGILYGVAIGDIGAATDHRYQSAFVRLIPNDMGRMEATHR